MAPLFFEDWSPEAEKQAAENMELSREISSCQEAIRKLQKRLNGLKRQRKDSQLFYKLRNHATGVWYSLGKKRKLQKDIILAALHSRYLPRELTEDELHKRQNKVFLDKDILLMRFKRREFQFWSDCDSLPPFDAYTQGDYELVRALFEALPRIAVHPQLPFKYLSDECIFLAMLRGPGEYYDKMQAAYYFSKNIRSSSRRMLELASLECSRTKSCTLTSSIWMSPLDNDASFALQLVDKVLCHDSNIKGLLRRFSPRLRDDEAHFL